MQQPNLIKIKGTVSHLHVWQGEMSLLSDNAAAVGCATAASVTSCVDNALQRFGIMSRPRSPAID